MWLMGLVLLLMKIFRYISICSCKPVFLFFFFTNTPELYYKQATAPQQRRRQTVARVAPDRGLQACFNTHTYTNTHTYYKDPKVSCTRPGLTLQKLLSPTILFKRILNQDSKHKVIELEGYGSSLFHNFSHYFNNGHMLNNRYQAWVKSWKLQT